MITLDLHGIRHSEVKNKVIRFLEDNWDCCNCVKIITGHSVIMKYLVTDTLIEYKLIGESSEYDPFIKVLM